MRSSRRPGVRGMPRPHLHAQVQTIAFYESLGFVVCGEEFKEAGILHREMEMV
jgi:predicted GNAT family N-acyltransferase